MTCLWIGDTRAKTRVCWTAFFHHLTTASGSSSVKVSALGTRLSSIVPVMTEKSSAPCSCSPSSGSSDATLRMLMRVAIARAVSGWSPVTMTTLTPARCAWSTASSTPRLGGSSMPNRPMNSKSFSGKLQSPAPVPSKRPFSGTSLWLKPRRAAQSTLRPCAIKSCNCPSILAMDGESPCTVQNLSTRSGAPFRIAKNSEPSG
mmetsp:Transcript_127746/g.355504  ORF Transcript_127746/g.355504 Transcript_127746/m.355504 type:complete len:203 (-) Transcript_127746:1730-2338(-)